VSQDFGGSGDDFAGSGDGNDFKATVVAVPAKINPTETNLPAALKAIKPSNRPIVPKQIIRIKRTATPHVKNKRIIPHDIPIWHES